MSTLFYRNLRLLLLSVILILVWGLSSYLTLPRLEDPELVSRSATVKTFFPGASAERVESLVTEKIEDRLSEIEEIDTYESTSRTGSSLIRIELLDAVKADEVDGIWSRVRNKIDDATPDLPLGTTEPELDRSEVKAYALIVGLTWERDEQPNWAILRRQAESLEDELKTLAGTEKVEIFGDPDEEIVVEIDTASLTSLGLTAQKLSQQILQSDAKVAAGQFRSLDNDLPIEVEELESLEHIQEIPIQFGDRGQFARLGNIALVKKGIIEPPSEIALAGDRPAIMLAVFVESGRRLDQWASSAHQTLNKFQEQLPNGLGQQVIFDQSSYVEARLNNLIFNLLLGASLVFGITLVMMGWQSAVIVGTALPLSILMVFGWMKLMGIPLHQMSVTGLIVALGLLIDTAIVVVDKVRDRLQAGLKPEAAIQKSIRYLAVPLFASTLTTVLAFLPIALLSGSVGEFVGTIGTNVIIALCSSLFLALTVIPALTAILHRYSNQKNQKPKQQKSRQLEAKGKARRSNSLIPLPVPQSPSPPVIKEGFSHPTLTQFYRWFLTQLLARPILGILLALILPIAGFLQAGNLEQQFFPAADRDQIQVEIELPASASLAQTRTLVEQARGMLLAHSEVAEVYWLAGRSTPQFYYNIPRGREQEANYAQALVQLNSLPKSAFVQELQAELDTAFPTARTLVRQLEQGPPIEAPIEMRLYGSDLDRLQKLGEQIRTQLVQVDYVTHTRASLDEVLPQLELQIDEEEARLAGLDRRSIAGQLETTLEGSTGGSILESTEELPVRVRVSATERGNLDQITSLDLLPISSSSNQSQLSSIPLSALGKVELNPEQAAIARYNGQRVNTIQGFIAAGVLPAEVLSAFQERLEQNFQLPSGYSFAFGGEAEERASAVGGLLSAVGVLIVLMVATLVLSLGSFRLAGIIGVVAISSLGLSFLSLRLFGYPFGFNAIIGTVGLVGVAINDSIVVLSALKEDSAARSGNRRAVRSVVVHSTRHVVTTTLTTMVGFVPLLLGGGEFWPPLAIAIAGGLGGATLLALFFVPCAYLLFVRGSTSRNHHSDQAARSRLKFLRN